MVLENYHKNFQNCGEPTTDRWTVGSIRPMENGMYQFSCYKNDDGFTVNTLFEIHKDLFRQLVAGDKIWIAKNEAESLLLTTL